MEFKKKKVIIIGTKSSGISAKALLEREGASVLLTDERNEEEGVKAVEKADLVVPSPGVGRDNPILTAAAKRGIGILGEAELGCRFLPCKKIMVTGTNGKTTVVTMIEKLLSFAVV